MVVNEKLKNSFFLKNKEKQYIYLKNNSVQ